MAINNLGLNVDLYMLIDGGYPLEKVLIKGRILRSDIHDRSGKPDERGLLPHTHWHRKILRTYDPKTDTVLLSHRGSLNSLGNLDIPEKAFHPHELYDQDWRVMPEDYEIF